MTIVIKRVYEPAESSDGFRVLVDRLWPRGVSKEKADLGLWAKEVAPSTELREQWNHDPARFAWFKKEYDGELAKNPAVADLRNALKGHAKVTLLYADHDEEVNNAVVLRDYLNAAKG